MSSRALTWAFNQQISHLYKSTLLALAEYANGSGVVSEYQEVLAADAGCNVRTLRRHLDHLESLGLIERRLKKRADGGIDFCQIQLVSTHSGSPRRAPPSGQDVPTPPGQNDRTPPDKMSGQETSFIPLEVKDVSSTNNTRAAREASNTSVSETDVGGATPHGKPQTANTPAPGGAASGEANEASPSPGGSKNAHQDGGNIDVTGSKKVPPGCLSPFRRALDAIDAAGLTPSWVSWVRLNALRQVSQEAQAPVWQEWIEAGLADELRENVSDLVQSGDSFSHPWGALRARLRKAGALRAAQGQAAAAFGPPTVQPGERRIAPSGAVWTVEVVEFGIVYFEEIGAPTDLGDVIVSRWPLEGSRE